MARELQSAHDQFGLYFIAQHPHYEFVEFQQRFLFPSLMALEADLLPGNRLIVFAPPRVGKSDTITVNFPAWYLGRHPDHSVIVISNSGDLAQGFGRKTRNLIESPLHRAIFPHCSIAQDSRARDDFSLTKGGHYYAMGFDAQIVGRGAHLFVIDDPIKNSQDATSEAQEQFRRETFTSAINTRLEPGGKLVLVMHRWPGDAFSGFLLDLYGRTDITQTMVSSWRQRFHIA